MGGELDVKNNTYYFSFPNVHVDKETHRNLSLIYSNYVHSTHKSFGIGIFVNNGNINFFTSNDDIYSLKTIYKNLERDHIIGKFDIRHFNYNFTSAFTKKDFINPYNEKIDFFEYIISYISWFHDISFLLYIILEPWYYEKNRKVFKIRIKLSLDDKNYSDKLISIIESYWGNANNRLKMVPENRINIFYKKYAYLDNTFFHTIIPYPGEHILKIKKKNVENDIKIKIPIGNDSVSSREINLLFNEYDGSTTFIIGQTGSGKSTLLLNIFSKIKELDYPIIVLDPTGDLAKKMINITDEKRTIYISPIEVPVSMNLMKSAHENIKYSAPKIAEDLIMMLKDVTESESKIPGGLVGTKIEDIIRNSVAGLAELPNTTILDIYDIISNEEKRKMFYSISKNEEFKNFLERIENMDDEDIGSTRRVLSFIKTNPILKEMLCSRSPLFDFGEIFEKNMIVIINGDRSNIGENVSKFILSSILTMIWINVQKKNKKAFLILDEIQEYSNSSLNEMVSMGRKNNVEILMATTHLSSLKPGIIDSLMANAKNFVIFKSSPSDSRDFSEKIGIDKNILINLDIGKAYFHSSYYSGIINTHNIKFIEKDYKNIISYSKMYVHNIPKKNKSIIYDTIFLKSINVEPSIEEIKNIRAYSKTGDQDSIEEELKDLLDNGEIEIKNNVISLKNNIVLDKRIEKLISLGLLIRENGENKYLCFPYPGFGSLNFFEKVNVEFLENEIVLNDKIYSLEEFLQIKNDDKLLKLIENMFGSLDGKNIIITSSRKISECFRKFYPNESKYYGNTLERAIKNELLRNKKAELIKTKIGKISMRVLKLNISKTPDCNIYIDNS